MAIGGGSFFYSSFDFRESHYKIYFVPVWFVNTLHSIWCVCVTFSKKLEIFPITQLYGWDFPWGQNCYVTFSEVETAVK